MRILIGALFAILVTSLISCVHKYAVPTAPRSHGVLPAASTVYVATPSDGRDDRPRTYEGSGSWTRSAIADALRERGMRIVPEGDVVEVPEAVIAAGKAGADFLVYTRIVHWSDRATEWSGIPDRITLGVEVYEVSTSTMLNRQEIRASSRWATFGGDHPQELLPELTDRWAETLIE